MLRCEEHHTWFKLQLSNWYLHRLGALPSMAYDPLPLIRLRPSPYLAHCMMTCKPVGIIRHILTLHSDMSYNQITHIAPNSFVNLGLLNILWVRCLHVWVTNRQTCSLERAFIICFIQLRNILYSLYIAVYLLTILQRSFVQHHTVPVTGDLLGPHERHANVSFIHSNNLHIIPTYQCQLS